MLNRMNQLGHPVVECAQYPHFTGQFHLSKPLGGTRAASEKSGDAPGRCETRSGAFGNRGFRRAGRVRLEEGLFQAEES